MMDQLVPGARVRIRSLQPVSFGQDKMSAIAEAAGEVARRTAFLVEFVDGSRLSLQNIVSIVPLSA